MVFRFSLSMSLRLGATAREKAAKAVTPSGRSPPLAITYPGTNSSLPIRIPSSSPEHIPHTYSNVALPPGIYSLLATHQPYMDYAITCPEGNGHTLYLAKAQENALNQQWKVSGSGVLMNMMSESYAFFHTPSEINAKVVRWRQPAIWMINVKRNDDGTFAGHIATGDSSMHYWGRDGSEVEMVAAPYDWLFKPIPIR